MCILLWRVVHHESLWVSDQLQITSCPWCLRGQQVTCEATKMIPAPPFPIYWAHPFLWISLGKRSSGKGNSSDHEGCWNDESWMFNQSGTSGSKKFKKTKLKEDSLLGWVPVSPVSCTAQTPSVVGFSGQACFSNCLFSEYSFSTYYSRDTGGGAN